MRHKSLKASTRTLEMPAADLSPVLSVRVVRDAIGYLSVGCVNINCNPIIRLGDRECRVEEAVTGKAHGDVLSVVC
jgi:hypothetical protein